MDYLIDKQFLYRKIMYLRILYEILYHFVNHNDYSIFNKESLNFISDDNITVRFINSLLNYQYYLSKELPFIDSPTKCLVENIKIKSLFLKLDEECNKFDINELKNEIGVGNYYSLIMKNIDLLFLVKGILTLVDSELKSNDFMIDFSYFCNRVICKLLVQEIRVLAVKWINK